MRPQEINRNINLAFKRFSRDGRLIHFYKCEKHLEKRLEWYRKTDPELTAEEAYYLDCIEKRNAVMGRMEYISCLTDGTAPVALSLFLKYLNRDIEYER